ncbi:hypothetical protein HK100_000491 [Physocladia obscura]|uniref:Fatty acid hydroxylase domain-containing protein n=1 Tax=Physocladia obscura TaxID=109957 RepID=A0AAD5TCL7_9FUNG|nr:hypothetical protein HK100_000491 [Physocladia obscura]
MNLHNRTIFEIHRIPTDQPQRKPNKVTVPKVIYTVAFQHLIQVTTALVLVVLTRPEDVKEWRMESPLLILIKIAIASVILDTYQYWIHRWFHVNRKLYRMFHSVHHELTVPFAFGALYNHPLEGFLMDTVGGAIPSMLLNMHPWTSAIFYSVATLKTVDDHCGYAWAWSPASLFNSNGAAYHDIHHWGKGGMYNFSQPFYTFWDHLMGTEYETAMARKKLQRETEEYTQQKFLNSSKDVSITSPDAASTSSTDFSDEKNSEDSDTSDSKFTAVKRNSVAAKVASSVLRNRKPVDVRGFDDDDDKTAVGFSEDIGTTSLSPTRSSKRLADKKKKK